MTNLLGFIVLFIAKAIMLIGCFYLGFFVILEQIEKSYSSQFDNDMYPFFMSLVIGVSGWFFLILLWWKIFM